MKPSLLVISVDPGAVKSQPDAGHKRIYASVNAAAFTLNQIGIRMRTLAEMLVEYDEKRRKAGAAIRGGQTNLDIGYERGNEIVGLAWDVVDWMDRLRKIMAGVSGVKKNTRWYRNIVESLKHAESLRNLFQHFDSSLKMFVTGTYPVMGSLAAAYPSDTGPYVRVLISTPARYIGDQTIHIAGFELPESVRGAVGSITLSVGEAFLDLSEVWDRLQRAKLDFAEYLRQEYGFSWPTP